ncbi:hypothetical protein [Streptomyces lacrimifluminis]|uniref:hypothetical protein n=1 Tax=Streptomyces lacrimifluminis TaxID=1500077 RepID=UPI00166EE416|nr:hypothetical protein [Streptomyces lacrimifluminis]
MSDETKLIAAFEEMRRGEGVTPARLHARPWLLDLLSTPDDPVAGLAALDQTINALGDRPMTRAVRNALNVNMEWHGDLEERRQWAYGVNLPKNERFLGVSRGTHIKYEKDGFAELAQLILTRAATGKAEAKSGDPFLDAAQQPLDEGDGSQPPTVEESAVPTRTLKIVIRRSHLVVLAVACLGAAAIVAPAAWDGEADKKATKSSASASPVAIPESDINHTSGWGPERKMYSVKKPAPYAVFNSLTDAYAFGDEREFLLCHEKEEKVNKRRWSNRIAAKDDQHYDCSAWFSNAVAPNLDEGNPAAQLHNARMKISVPADMPVYNPGLLAEFTADNAQTVWASCNFLAEKPITIHYIPGSTYLTTKKTQEKYGDKGLLMSDGDNNLFDPEDDDEAALGGIAKAATGGGLIGEGKQDGIVRQAGGWVQFTILVKFADKPGGH